MTGIKPAVRIVEWFDRTLPGPYQVTIKNRCGDGIEYVYGGFPDYARALKLARQYETELGITKPSTERRRSRARHHLPEPNHALHRRRRERRL